MVKAILSGAKTQTRRIVPVDHSLELGWQGFRADYGHRAFAEFGDPKKPTLVLGRYGWIGSKLWVREAWRIGAWQEDAGLVAIDYQASPELAKTPWVKPSSEWFTRNWQRISHELEVKGIQTDADGRYHWEPGCAPLDWCPSIHMPRCASRITLEVGNEFAIRVERLQEISWMDAIAEGIPDPRRSQARLDPKHGPVAQYRTLWNSINLKPKPVLEKGKTVRYESYPWSAQDFDVAFPGIRESGAFRDKPLAVIPNPWVWVIEFKKLEAPHA